MEILNTLEPVNVWKYFEEISKIPHGSGNMKQISDYCVNFARKHHLRYKQDEHYNIIIWKDATSGYEQAPTVILQGHMDMVAVKEAACTLDLSCDGLELEVNGDFLEAKGTSLGGDDGIAIAYALAILASDTLEHPALEAIFTVDEEIGLLGAASVDVSDVKGRLFLNLDSEDEGIFLTSCAGGATVEAVFNHEPMKKVSGPSYTLSITGLTGGHSGAEIHKQRANANVLLGRILFDLEKNDVDFQLGSVNGGEKDNAIATFASAKIILSDVNAIDAVKKAILSEYQLTDPAMTIELLADGGDLEVFTKEEASRIILALTHLPYGIQKMSEEVEGLVQTSLNLGVLSTDEKAIRLCYSVRSSIGSEKDYLIDKICSLTKLLGGDTKVSGEYPGWAYKKDSYLRDTMVVAYEKLYGKKPILQGIHAGVECGLFADKLEGLDCISIGPQMHDIHTTKERLSISSTQRTWELVVETLRSIK